MLNSHRLPANARTNLRHKIRRRMVPEAKLSDRATMRTRRRCRKTTATKSSDIDGMLAAAVAVVRLLSTQVRKKVKALFGL